MKDLFDENLKEILQSSRGKIVTVGGWILPQKND